MRLSVIVIIFCFVMPSCKSGATKVPAASVSVQRLPYYNGPDFYPQWFEGDVPDTFHRIPSFSFIDQNGNSITEKTVEGKIYVADFFYTGCPGICPKLTKNLYKVQEAFKSDSTVLILSHSVTPVKDDTAALKKYARNYSVIDSKWHLLTGNKDSIYTIARKAYFADEDMGVQKSSDDFLHTENMLLIDYNRRIRGIYKGTSPAEMENIINDIRLLEIEMAAKQR